MYTIAAPLVDPDDLVDRSVLLALCHRHNRFRVTLVPNADRKPALLNEARRSSLNYIYSSKF